MKIHLTLYIDKILKHIVYHIEMFVVLSKRGTPLWSNKLMSSLFEVFLSVESNCQYIEAPNNIA